MNAPSIPASMKGAPRLGSDSTTAGVRVTVAPTFEPDHSDADSPQYVFSYRIRITNTSDQPARLVARRWLIIDAHGAREEVSGEGVIGQQPRLMPGESFEYASFCRLRTRWGTMEGAYTMQRDDGETFDVNVARFYLAPGEDQ